MKIPRICSKILLALLLSIIGQSATAAQQFQGLCSFIKIEIQQTLALERVGFLATLELTNNEGDAVLTDFSSVLTFEREVRDENDNVTRVDASDMFFVQPAVLSGIASIDGDGLIEPGETARVEWFIIPKISAGGESQAGQRYLVGAQLGGSLYGQEIDPEVLRAIPDTITVRPEPQLEITYFQPRDVDGDNPFTPSIVEAPVPFTLGVLVKNSGFGQAQNVTIDSEQPEIVENTQGLLVVPKLLGARVGDVPLSGTPTLKLDLGDIPPGSCSKGAWDMITTLSGEFTEFNARYTHSDELGGESTSLIKEINAYFMVREVLNDQPGRDTLYDFLATTDTTQIDLIPDTLFESDCNTVPVNQIADASVGSFNGTVATVQATAAVENWLFIRVDDPGQDKLPIDSIVRSDGKLLNPRNYWTNTRYDPNNNDKLTYLNIFDFFGSALGDYTYEVTYAAVAGDDTPPVSTLQFFGDFEVKEGVNYILPNTQLFFVVQDFSPTGSFYRTDSADEFQPAYPFSIREPGTYTLEFYAEDDKGNREDTQTATIVVQGDYPTIANFQSSVDQVLLAGDALSVRPTDITFSVDVDSGSGTLSAVAEVYQGVFAWPTLRGIPASPTPLTDAQLVVGGNNVDFYQYRIDEGAWSVEAPAADVIALDSLSNGPVRLDVRARHTQGSYSIDEMSVLSVSWQVDTQAIDIRVVGTPATPSVDVNAVFMVEGVDLYRYTIDDGFFRAEEPISTPFGFERLAEGEHVVSVFGQTGGVWQDQVDAVTVKWLIDRNYGFGYDDSNLVFAEDLESVSGLTRFSWNGLRQNGAAAEPGWYTVLLTLTDGLGRQSRATTLVRVGDLLPDNQLLSDSGTARQSEVHGRGKWVVWQDQRSGSWDIYAKDILNPSSNAQAVTTSSRNQERPRTDGEHVVWQARQSNGSWDIWAKNLKTGGAPFSITSTSGSDEIKPVVEWPWVVYQRHATDNSNAPWQLFAKNMLTGDETAVDSTSQDQIDADIHLQRIVWQDHRDVGPGEVYFKDLVDGMIKRITQQPAGQFHPVIQDQWIVWADNRDLQFDLYAYNLLTEDSSRLTSSPEDETRPRLNGQWMVYEEDLAGEQRINLRLMHLSNFAAVQLTNAPSNKDKPSIVSGKVVWTELSGSSANQETRVRFGSLPDLQPVFDNRNTIAVTEGLLEFKSTAHALLELWNSEAGVVELTRYSQLVPTLVSQTVTWNGGAPAGDDYQLAAGDFLWVKFAQARVLDFANSDCTPQNLQAGISVLSTACIPDDYTFRTLIADLGEENVASVRMLNAQQGRWSVARVDQGNRVIGDDEIIAPIAVLLVEMKQAVNQWLPGTN